MNGWFITLVILGVLNIGINLAKHGEPSKENYNFFGALFGYCFQLVLIYMAIKTGF